jgi:hypothetical protein
MRPNALRGRTATDEWKLTTEFPCTGPNVPKSTATPGSKSIHLIGLMNASLPISIPPSLTSTCKRTHEAPQSHASTRAGNSHQPPPPQAGERCCTRAPEGSIPAQFPTLISENIRLIDPGPWHIGRYTHMLSEIGAGNRAGSTLRGSPGTQRSQRRPLPEKGPDSAPSCLLVLQPARGIRRAALLCLALLCFALLCFALLCFALHSFD